ncbi:MAG: ATP-binding protein [Candidatus Phocaeicola faecipullorum]|nr:ATP-binding protein [Candidatus Phocaeicola faecipullorum]
MKRILIRNFGPIKDAELQLGQVNIITGLQSSGKSCILKVACYCSYVEKRIELSQRTQEFSSGTSFIDLMTGYYDIANYIQDKTYIEYEGVCMKFSYDNSVKKFTMEWKSSRWEYKRSKVTYIPADRNLVASIPGWSSMPLDKNMIEFMANWDKARKFLKEENNLLNLGISYIYDSSSNSDSIVLENGKPLKLKEGSSGIQSLLPMYVHLDYITSGQYKDNNVKISYEQAEERKNLLSTIYASLYRKDKTDETLITFQVGGYDYSFSDVDEANRFMIIYDSYLHTHHSDIYLEEPENNLFPPTQCQFIRWLVEAIKKHNDTLFIATHSPYILNELIKQTSDGLRVFFTHRTDNETPSYTVRQLSNEEVEEMYGNGVDIFFNFELYL